MKIYSIKLKKVYVIHGYGIIQKYISKKHIEQKAYDENYTSSKIINIENKLTWSQIKSSTINDSLFFQKKIITIKIHCKSIDKSEESLLINLIKTIKKNLLLIIILNENISYIKCNTLYNYTSKYGVNILTKIMQKPQIENILRLLFKINAYDAKKYYCAIKSSLDENETDVLQAIKKTKLTNINKTTTKESIIKSIDNSTEVNIKVLIANILNGEITKTIKNIHNLKKKSTNPKILLLNIKNTVINLLKIESTKCNSTNNNARLYYTLTLKDSYTNIKASKINLKLLKATANKIHIFNLNSNIYDNETLWIFITNTCVNISKSIVH